jgi:hypothetical protein
MALERNGPAASDEGEDKGLLRTARDGLEEGPGGWSVAAAFSDLEMQELGVTPPHPPGPAGHPPVAVALEADASDLGDREAVLRTTPRIKREWQNQYLRCVNEMGASVLVLVYACIHSCTVVVAGVVGGG